MIKLVCDVKDCDTEVSLAGQDALSALPKGWVRIEWWEGLTDDQLARMRRRMPPGIGIDQ